MRPKLGNIVEVIFDDHADGEHILRFRVYGVLLAITREQYTVGSWVYDDNYRTHDANVESRSIVRKAVVQITVLK